jgi:hypothetical protein
MAATVLADDPLFGWTAYGGTLKQSNRKMEVIPRDGVRSRFWIVDSSGSTGIELNRDGFMKEMPVSWSERSGTIEFIIENRAGDTHTTRLTLNSGSGWEIINNGKKVGEYNPGDSFTELQISGNSNSITLKRKR